MRHSLIYTTMWSSNLSVQKRIVLASIQRKLILIKDLLPNFTILKKNNPIPITLQIFVVSHHHDGDGVRPLRRRLVVSIPKIVNLQQQIHHLDGWLRVQVPRGLVQQDNGGGVGQRPRDGTTYTFSYTLCCSPPDSSLGRWSARSDSPTLFSSILVRSFISFSLRTPRMRMGSSMFS